MTTQPRQKGGQAEAEIRSLTYSAKTKTKEKQDSPDRRGDKREDTGTAVLGDERQQGHRRAGMGEADERAGNCLAADARKTL